MIILDGALFQRALYGAYKKLNEKKEEVNRLNVFPVPDGDTGTNMSLTMKSAAAQIERVKDLHVASVGKALGNGSLMGARGNSGVILSQLCRGISEAVKDKQTIVTSDIAAILGKATEMAYKAVMKPTEGTILTVARSMSEFAAANVSHYTEIEDFLRAILTEGNRTLAKTPDMLKALKDAGVVDAGGQGLLYLVAGFLETLTGEMTDEILLPREEAAKSVSFDADPEDSDIRFGYCTEFFIRTRGDDYLAFRGEIEGLGDSIVCIGMDDVIKTHIHTNHPGKVLELALKRGALMDIKIDNMRLQHQHRLLTEKEEAQLGQEPTASMKPNKPYGFVAVSLGAGFDSIFKDLMVDELVSGGQTMNPSTQDLLEAVNRVAADTVFIFPNNKNIIMAAEQVDALTEKRVIVIPSRSIPHGFTALLQFDESATPEENAEAMTESLNTVQIGQITYSIRDTEMDDLVIHEGDLIGLMNGHIVRVGQNAEELVQQLVGAYVTDEHSLITVYSGEDVQEEQAQKLMEALRSQWPEYDVEYERGDQPTYYYIFSIE